MSRRHVLSHVSTLLVQCSAAHPIRVAIDGIDAAGKTTLADELAVEIQNSNRPVIRASIDGFQHPRHIRYERGNDSAEGYYYDSFDFQAIIDCLLKPLGPKGNLRFRNSIFDYHTDRLIDTPFLTAPPDAILLVDGVFLLRPELLPYWDFKIFVDVTFETAMNRALQRDLVAFEDEAVLQSFYEKKYFAGQRLYFEQCNPKNHANLIIDNNVVSTPLMVTLD